MVSSRWIYPGMPAILAIAFLIASKVSTATNGVQASVSLAWSVSTTRLKNRQSHPMRTEPADAHQGQWETI
jgi:hypothetical protein